MFDAVALLGLVVASLALAVALSNVLLRAHRAGRGTADPAPPVAAPPAERPARRKKPRGSVEDTLPLSESARRQIPPPERRPPPQESIQVAEPLLEADAAGAAGFYREVSELLRAQLQVNPARLDLHRKLLEVYGAAGEADAYLQSARAYLQRSDARADPYWPEIARTGREFFPEHELFADGDRAGAAAPRFQRFYEAVSPTLLQQALRDLGGAYEAARKDGRFRDGFRTALADLLGRPTPLAPLQLLPAGRGGARVYVKREDGRQAQEERLINALGQVLLARHLGRTRIVTATRDGLHGLAVASAAGRQALGCTIFMDEPSQRRHFARVLQMRRLGADVRMVPPGATDAASWQAALQAWVEDPATCHYVSSLAAGPHPFPAVVRDFQSVVGEEALAQLRAQDAGPLCAVVAGMADGYVGLGLLNAFIGNGAELYCVESAAGETPRQLREHGWLRASGRVRYLTATEDETLDTVDLLFRTAGLAVPACSARTLACARRLAAAADAGVVLSLLSCRDEPAAQPA